jgi:hypothetical protein
MRLGAAAFCADDPRGGAARSGQSVRVSSHLPGGVGHPARGDPPTAAVTYCDSRADDMARGVGPGGQRVGGVRR